MPRFYDLKGEAWVASEAKRRMDVVLAAGALPIALPIGALAIGMSRVLDGRDTIYTQTRVGQYGELFDMSKIRTMKAADPGQAATEREEITTLGSWLRPTAIDEMPQLFDILDGRMSFIGPRAVSEDFSESMSQALDPATNSKWRYTQYVSRPGGISTHQITNRLGIANKMIALDEGRLRLKAAMDLYDFNNASFSYDLGLIRRAAAATAGAGVGVLLGRESSLEATENESSL